MPWKEEMRGLSVALIRNKNRVLVTPGHDDVKGIDFYRLPGGGIEFGEYSLEALKREIKEELGAELKNIKLLEVLENIFVFNGRPGHEISFIYEAEFADEALYERESFDALEGDEKFSAVWLDVDENNIDRIFPGNLRPYLL